ncbi:ImmA/IrrE family metallo-endopeptidase [Adhaeribacter radiodurans]|uniref:ImmA/IrrE family metallo-endopeptidase n=1 Tax=Adhaeribacter radiodurans TaxID=2745197 RepID=A0A7L7L1F0_9BACT|nr:ImmA/IrrE family metallo-endopeptidase [Adhaeribacter radiodurans]QMU26600.1 ImmA/IrrE family metallo-endopeptidase [Adhaeribacter radiodurans]
MNRKRLRQIEKCAEDSLRMFDLYSEPIDVSALAKNLNLNIIYHDLAEDISGLLITNLGQSTIGVNSNNIEFRQRFTIAHEIGHYLLEHQREGVFIDKPSNLFTIVYRDQNSSTGEFLQEREANAFAAALLMPRELVNLAIKNTKFNFEDDQVDVIQCLAIKFKVSSQAMGFRLANLDLLW